MNFTITPGTVLYPPKRGLNHQWQPGEVAILNCVSKVHCLILCNGKRQDSGVASLECLDSADGGVYLTEPQDLLTVEGWLSLCDRMRSNWTSHEYCKMVNRAAGGFPFIVPDWFPDAVTRAFRRIGYGISGPDADVKTQHHQRPHE